MRCSAWACQSSTVARETTQQLSKAAYWKMWEHFTMKTRNNLRRRTTIRTIEQLEVTLNKNKTSAFVCENVLKFSMLKSGISHISHIVNSNVCNDLKLRVWLELKGEEGRDSESFALCDISVPHTRTKTHHQHLKHLHQRGTTEEVLQAGFVFI